MKLFTQWWESTGAHDDRGVAARISQRQRPRRKDWFKAWLRPDKVAKKTLSGRLKQAAAIGFVVWGFVFFIGLASFIVIGVFRLGPRTAAKGVAMFAALCVPMCLCMGGLVALIFRATGVEKKRLVMFMGARLGQKQCASCEYELGDVPVSEDGCTVCPECSAAWRVDLWVRDWARRPFDRSTKFPGKWRVLPIDMANRPLMITSPQRTRVKSLVLATVFSQLRPNWVDFIVVLCIAAIFVDSKVPAQTIAASLVPNQPWIVIFYVRYHAGHPRDDGSVLAICPEIPQEKHLPAL